MPIIVFVIHTIPYSFGHTDVRMAITVIYLTTSSMFFTLRHHYWYVWLSLAGSSWAGVATGQRVVPGAAAATWLPRPITHLTERPVGCCGAICFRFTSLALPLDI